MAKDFVVHFVLVCTILLFNLQFIFKTLLFLHLPFKYRLCLEQLIPLVYKL